MHFDLFRPLPNLLRSDRGFSPWSSSSPTLTIEQDIEVDVEGMEEGDGDEERRLGVVIVRGCGWSMSIRFKGGVRDVHHHRDAFRANNGAGV